MRERPDGSDPVRSFFIMNYFKRSLSSNQVYIYIQSNHFVSTVKMAIIDAR